MLFFKELKRVCLSPVYVLFLALLLFSWNENFRGGTEEEIAAAAGEEQGIAAQLMGGAILAKPREGADHYGGKREEIPEKIMCGGIDNLIREYLANSYATYPFTYYKEVVLSQEEQEKILAVIEEITGLGEEQIRDLPEGYFPRVNGNIIHMGDNAEAQEGSYSYRVEESGVSRESKNYTQKFVAQVSYERFKELMGKVEKIVGKGSSYSMEQLLAYYGQGEMTYEEALKEYERTIYEDRVSVAFARLFCDYMTRALGLYPVFLAAALWLRDRPRGRKELLDSKQIGTAKFVFLRFLALLAAALAPVLLLSLESLIPLLGYGAETGIAIDALAFVKYILWWLLPTAAVVTALGMALTIFTCTPLAVLAQLIWWFADSAATGLSGDTRLFTLMVRHNTLRGGELIRENWEILWLNRGLMLVLAALLVILSAGIAKKKREGKLDYGSVLEKYVGIFKTRLSSGLRR